MWKGAPLALKEDSVRSTGIGKLSHLFSIIIHHQPPSRVPCLLLYELFSAQAITCLFSSRACRNSLPCFFQAKEKSAATTPKLYETKINAKDSSTQITTDTTAIVAAAAAYRKFLGEDGNTIRENTNKALQVFPNQVMTNWLTCAFTNRILFR